MDIERSSSSGRTGKREGRAGPERDVYPVLYVCEGVNVSSKLIGGYSEKNVEQENRKDGPLQDGISGGGGGCSIKR